MTGGVAAPVLPTPEKKFAGVTYEKKFLTSFVDFIYLVSRVES